MDQPNNIFKSFFYILAALAGAGLIIYGAFFYTKPKPASQQAKILPENNSSVEVNFQEPVLGNPSAPVTMIEYGSYLCGHCINFSLNTFPKIEEKYIKTDKVKFIYRSFPPIELGMALICASEQNKYWEYHNQAIGGNITKEDDLKIFAGAIGLDTTKFNECLDSKKYQATAEKIIKEGENLGVEGTPTFFINNQKFVGSLSYEDFQKIIDGELKK